MSSPPPPPSLSSSLSSPSTPSASMMLWSSLPDGILENIGLHLATQDILSLISVNKRFNVDLGQSVSFWNELSQRDGQYCYNERIMNNNEDTTHTSFAPPTTTTTTASTTTNDDDGTTTIDPNNHDDDSASSSVWRHLKESYLFYCCKNDPTRSGGGVKWYPVRPYGRFTGIDSREGHLACVLKRNHARVFTTTTATGKNDTASQQQQQQQQQQQETLQFNKQYYQKQHLQERTIVITGGFSNDDSIYLIHAGTGYAAIDAANTEAGERDTQLYGLGVRGLFRQRQQTQSSSSSSLPVPPQQPFRGHRWKMERLQPTNRTQFVYGASLTPLPTIYHRHRHQKSQQESKGQTKHKQKKGIGDDNNNDKDKNSIDYDGSQHQHQHQKSSKTVVLSEMRALRFGGFRAGGYSNETSAVSLLSIKEVMNDDLGEEEQQEPSSSRRHRLTGFPGRFFRRHQNQQQHSSTSWVAEWTDISCSSFPRNSDNSMSIDDDNDDLDKDNLSRAYHSATLILNRYLLVIGGMKSTGSIMNIAILDTLKWEWIQLHHSDIMHAPQPEVPSNRHGHSVVFDDTRNRFVLFGGGSGSDLLRSGIDNSQVWELKMTKNEHDWRTDFVNSFPWKWKKLHDDCNTCGVSTATTDTTANTGDDSMNVDDKNNLSPAETLCLGRCHNCVKISRDTVLLFFGNGRPSTNKVIAYDLKTDTFICQKQEQDKQSTRSATDVTGIAAATAASIPQRRVNIVDNSGVHVTGDSTIPKPRFTGVSAYLEEDGYIVTHGGYCSQDQDTIGTMDVLDLAPVYSSSSSSKFDGLAIDEERVSYAEITNDQAERGRGHASNEALQAFMLNSLVSTPRGPARQRVAQHMLNSLRNNDDAQAVNPQVVLIINMIANGNDPLLTATDDEDENDDDNGEDEGESEENEEEEEEEE